MFSCSDISKLSRVNYTVAITDLVLNGVSGNRIYKLRRDERAPPAALATLSIMDLRGTTLWVNSADFRSHVTVDQLNNLRKSVGWLARNDDVWQKVFDQSTNIVCVKDNDNLIGFGCFSGNSRMGTIFDVHVHPDHQQKGVGTSMMNHLVNEIKCKKYFFVGLFAWEENKNVMSFYEKFGFKSNPYAMHSSAQELVTYQEQSHCSAEFRNHVTVDQLNNLRNNVGWLPRSKGVWKKVFDQSTSIVSVKDNDNLIGFACLSGNGRMGTIFDVHVHPNHQRSGVGMSMMNHLVNEIKSMGYASVGLFVGEENKEVMSFYEKFGFKPNPYAMESSAAELVTYQKYKFDTEQGI